MKLLLVHYANYIACTINILYNFLFFLLSYIRWISKKLMQLFFTVLPHVISYTKRKKTQYILSWDDRKKVDSLCRRGWGVHSGECYKGGQPSGEWGNYAKDFISLVLKACFCKSSCHEKFQSSHLFLVPV